MTPSLTSKLRARAAELAAPVRTVAAAASAPERQAMTAPPAWRTATPQHAR